MPEWMTDISRGPWVANGLKHRRDDLRRAATKCRKSFNKEYMGEPARWYADALDEAAALLEAKLVLIDAANQQTVNEI